MNEFTCSSCGESWSVKEGKISSVKCCPFCAFEIPKSKEIIVTSFETAIQKVINDLTIEVLKNGNQFIAYLMDIGPQFQKEIHILSKICDNSIFNRLYKLFQLPAEEIGFESVKLRDFLMNEEGVSEIWAKKIIESFTISNEELYLSEDCIKRKTTNKTTKY